MRTSDGSTYINFLGYTGSMDDAITEFNDLQRVVLHWRRQFLANGGDPVDFPAFLAEQGVTVDGPWIKMDQSATVVSALLKPIRNG